MLSRAPLPERAETPDRLVAYIVCRPGRTVSVSDLRKFLERRLPDFMVPAQFVFLESLPLNPNGKVDRRALPEPETATPRDPDFAAPRDETEAKLARIWSEVLCVETVGAHDNFFRLGGHSLLALQVMARVRDGFHADLPLRVLFESPTIAALADVLARTPKNDSAGAIRKIPRRRAESFPTEPEIR